MGRIRPLEEADIPAIADLRRRLFKSTAQAAPGQLEDYFRRIFLLNPFVDPELPSIVYEEGGEPAGFIGVIPRPMLLGRESVRSIVSTQFMVAPAVRGLTAIQMVKHLFAGRQDLTYVDASPTAIRKMWVGLGGVTAWAYSLMWEAPVRPSPMPESSRVRRLGQRLGAALPGQLGRAVTGLAASRGVPVPTEPIEPGAIADLAATLIKAPLRPAYHREQLAWVLDVAGGKRSAGPLRCRVVPGEHGHPAGWFVYRAPAGGAGYVLQLGAAPPEESRVLLALVQDAWDQGVHTLRGAAEPGMLSAYDAFGWPVVRRGPWVLVQSKRPELLAAVGRGEAWFSSLDGERWLNF
ncbi:MAG: hypothetical protein JNJ80_10750 [Gemmatimonadetes bacterium]|nr:hypothetical protein [Gemmatimonadota bacterium]